MDEKLGMPVGQLNAVLDDEMVMRVGIPHKGGRLAFHAFNEGYPAMVSANAFWNAEKRRFAFPEATNVSELDFALDSAGYTAMALWKSKGTQRGMAGVFPWTYAEYLEFAALTGWLMLGETLTIQAFLGCTLMLCGMIWSQARP